MTICTLELEIWKEAKAFFRNKKLRLKDLLEWSTTEIIPDDDSEVVVKLPKIKCYVCIEREYDRRKIGGVK